jgi:hypothetical protein
LKGILPQVYTDEHYLESNLMKNDLILFEDYKVRRLYDEETETWYFSVIDIVQILTQQPDFQAARNYWNVLKTRLNKEGSQSLTNCKRLKLEAADGKKYLTDVANAETVLRLIQSIPSPKAEPIKLWLAKVGYERIQEMTDPERSLDRARETWQKHGRSEKWIQQRMMGRILSPRFYKKTARKRGFFLMTCLFNTSYCGQPGPPNWQGTIGIIGTAPDVVNTVVLFRGGST